MLIRLKRGDVLNTRFYTAPTDRRQAETQDAFYSQIADSSVVQLDPARKTSSSTPQTLTEKIVQNYSIGLPDGKFVRSGDYVTLAPHQCMTHDNSWPVALKFMSIGASKIHNRKQIVMTLDHDVQNKSESNLKKYRQIEQFAREQGVDFYPAGRGIGHQIMVEEGYAWPGTLAVASDSHTNMYGGIGCLGTPVVRTDAASIWATGRTWWQIPPIAKVTFIGTLPKGVTGKDVIVALCGLFNNDEVLNHAIEFTGSPETLSTLAIDDRLAIANMTTEWGALSGLFPIDPLLQRWLRLKATEALMYHAASLSSSSTKRRINHARLDALFRPPQLSADPGAKYAKNLFLNLSTVQPYVSGPNSVKVATPLSNLESQSIKIDKAYLVSCTNSRASDLAAAAKVFKDAAVANNGVVPKIPDHVHFYIAAASAHEQQAAKEQGDWQAMLDAGAKPLPSGCGPCIGLGTGLLEPGEVGISASNRNFKGRMGSRDAKAYLASPEVVAASALQGKIAGPGWYEKPEGVENAKVILGEGTGEEEVDKMMSVEEALEKVIAQAEENIGAAESSGITSSNDDPAAPSSTTTTAPEDAEPLTDILPGFPEKVSGEIVFCSGDNINTDAIYPGKYTYQDDVPPATMAAVCMENYDPAFATTAQAGDILVAGFNFGCGSSREQAATALLAKGIPLVVAGSFGNIFQRNSINNALMGVEVPKLVRRLREAFAPAQVAKEGEDRAGEKEGGKAVSEPEANRQSLDTPPPGPVEKQRQDDGVLTRRTGWTLEWDVRRSLVSVEEGKGGEKWSQKVGELPPNVQEIIARGGLEKWVAAEIGKES
ncbi:MAG: hypothetical protein Q9157_002916 [Trypethelium eluteriae]